MPRRATTAGTAARVHLQRVSAEGGDRIVLRVADDGPGVPAPLRDKVLGRFFRAEAVSSGFTMRISLPAVPGRMCAASQAP